ncbi:peptidase S8 [Flavobacterium silvisoli]|uniref:Peptidase S8 n=1 Tax=Flavobacterium silvisoli TaxID=2529433 RepID=A0A4Q9Z8U5_9FLAO|nr:S8 family peptidase [Flavobacterium silvisoli]TBX71177.1 peptidase S8 [Flavobacterium silvisoli]
MKFIKIFVLSLFSLTVAAQTADKSLAKKGTLTEQQLQRWSHLDLVKDSIPGMSVDKAYNELLKGKKSTKVIVGVIDSGVDINHDDLKSVIWTNKKEIPGNGVDDDKNGYTDDVHGWNFLGESNNENLELVRILKKPDDGSAAYKAALEDYEKKNQKMLKNKFQVDFIIAADKNIREYLNKENYTIEDLKAITSSDKKIYQSKMVMLSIAEDAGEGFRDDINDYKEQVYDQLNFNLNKDFDGRKIVGDNPEDITNKIYGNNVVYSKERKDSFHGTHVAGIIAQVRNNNLGGDGVADNVEILPVRAVPNGDEYDKDIALAIRYAVDNGAKVINGSFGKDYSPHKEWVWDAIKYAESKDVLLVFAAGNDGKNIDVEPSFPADTKDKKTEIAKNVLTIGALDNKYGENMVADFSNYGQKNVDIFAPGVKIYATVGDNKYKYEQGTSMASPNAAGVAALIRSYYPSLKAAQVKQIIMQSGTPVPFDVVVGETAEKMPFSKTCVSGKIVNAYNALKMAETMAKKTKKNPKL